jgi:hypothetical protein
MRYISAPQRSQIVLSSVDSGAFVNAEAIGVMVGFAVRSDTSAL